MSSLSPAEIEHLGRLARLDLNNEEKERYAGQLSSVVAYVEQLSQVSTDQKVAQVGVSGLHNVLAADQPRPEEDPLRLKREDLLKGAPIAEDGFFVVRAVLGEEGVGA